MMDAFLFGRVVDEYGHELEVLEPWALFEVFDPRAGRPLVKVETEERARELCATYLRLDYAERGRGWVRAPRSPKV